MKLEGLKKLIKEELKRTLNEELKNQAPTEPGKYKVKYTTDNGSGGDDEIVTITQEDIDDAEGSAKIWQYKIDNYLFGRGDRVMDVEKLENQSFNESLTPEEEIELDNIEDIIRYKGNSSDASGNTRTKERYDFLINKRDKSLKK